MVVSQYRKLPPQEEIPTPRCLSPFRSRSKRKMASSPTNNRETTTNSASSMTDLVDAASQNFGVLEGNMKELLHALKAQHTAMVNFGEKRLKTVKQFESFAANTPLSQIVGKVSRPTEIQAKPKVQESLQTPELVDTESEGSAPSPPSSPGSAASSSTTSEGHDSERSTNPKKKDHAKSSTTSSTKSKTDTTRSSKSSSSSGEEEEKSLDATFSSEETPLIANLPPKEKQSIQVSEAEKQSIRMSLEMGTEVTQVDEDSYGAVLKSGNNVTTMYSNLFHHEIIVYAENWIKVVSERIKARQLQFQELEKKLQHYTKKVTGLEEKKQQQEQKNVSPPAKQQERFDRNQLKLRGAREAYDNSGQSLLLLMEEVTERAWKDFYPLLLKTMSFELNYEMEMSKFFAKLDTTIAKLERIGRQHKLKPRGRLQSIEKSHPEELYTGNKRMVRPVLDSSITVPQSANTLYSV